jgi:hypothetical protein
MYDPVGVEGMEIAPYWIDKTNFVGEINGLTTTT